MRRRRVNTEFTRNFIFGVEDSLVSTVGFVSGIAAAGVSKSTVLLSGIILIFVEAFSMGVGSLLSENSVEEMEEKEEVPLYKSLRGAVIMFLSYFFTGFVVLAPYVLAPLEYAFEGSIAISLVALFVLGVLSAKYARVHMIKRGLVMLLIGGGAILLGVLVGQLIN